MGARPSPGSPHRSLGGAGRKVCREADLPHCCCRPGRGHPAPNTQTPVMLHAALPSSEGSQAGGRQVRLVDPSESLLMP